MDLKKSYPLDKEILLNGISEQFGDATIILSYYNSSKTQMFFHAELQKYRRDMDPEDAVITAMRSTLSEKVVLGWENLYEDDNEIIYSKEACLRLLNEYEGLDIDIMTKAMNIARFKIEQERVTQGN